MIFHRNNKFQLIAMTSSGRRLVVNSQTALDVSISPSTDAVGTADDLDGGVLSKIPRNDMVIDLDDGKIYRKALYLMVKTKPWFPVDFPLNQSIDMEGFIPLYGT